MKKIYFFDLDNTLHSTNLQEIPSQTIELIKRLSKEPNTYIGLATGRGPTKIPMLKPYIDLFTYKIFINGALAYKKDELIYENPIDKKDIKEVLKEAKSKNISVGMVTSHGEYITEANEAVDFGMKGFNEKIPTIDPLAYEKYPVFQLWMFSKNVEDIIEISKKYKNYVCYPWHQGGADLVRPETNKAIAIKHVLKGEDKYKLITVGDGHNDIKMIELADIGIAMGNSGFSELKEKADYIAPNVDDNQLYDFFKEIKLID